MSDTNLVIAQLKHMMTEVLELRDQKPEAQTRAIEFLKATINALHLGRKTSAKVAAPTPQEFDNGATEFLYGLTPDVEVGAPNGGGWHGLYLGNLAEGLRGEAQLTKSDMDTLHRNNGAIIHEDTNGLVTGSFFPLEEDAVDNWEESISGNEPELSHI